MLWTICMLALAKGWDSGLSPDNIPDLVEVRALERWPELAPIRFHIDESNFDLGSTDLKTEFDLIMAEVKEGMASIVKVYSVLGELVLDGLTKCGDEIDVPSDHSSTGVDDADILLYLATESAPDASYAAYGAPCAIEGGNRNGVVAGRIVINTPVYATGSTAEKITEIMHQLMHVLGFISSAIPKFYSALDLTKVTQIRGYNKTIFVGTTVKEKARKAFGCDSLQGLEFEDDGNNWDMRVMYGDFMTAQSSPYPVFSDISFALLADSGWYSIDFTNIGHTFFGYQKGCDFLYEACVQDGVAQFSEFCNDDSRKCDSFHIYKAECNLTNYPDDLEAYFQYFDDPKTGGENPLMDYCPYLVPTDGGNCRDPNTPINENWGEAVCDTCRCIGGTLIRAEEGDGLDYHSGCYEVLACDESSAILRIGLNNYYHAVSCPFTGGEVSVPGFAGYLDCPNSSILCENFPCINGCYGQGKCVYGKCQCNAGRGGVDCSVACENDCYTCEADAPGECLGCEGENAVLNSNNECVCPDGYREVGIDCLPECADLCVGCASNNDKNCDACVENATKQSNGACICNPGYIQSEGECKYDDFPVIDFTFTRTDELYQYGDFNVRFHGDMKPAPRMGLFGNTESYAEIYTDNTLNINESTQSVRMWIWVSSATDGAIYSAYSPEYDLTTLQLRVTEKGELRVNVTDILAINSLTMPDLPIQQWVQVGYSIEYDQGKRSNLCLYIDTNSVCLQDAFDIYMDFSTSPAVRLGSFDGFVMSIKVYYGIIDPEISEMTDNCVNPPSCDVEPGNCQAGYVGDECKPCDCGGEPCARETDCRKNVDEKCYSFDDMYYCDACYPGATLTQGQCYCRDNSEFDNFINECECIDQAFEENGQCIVLFTCGPLCQTCEDDDPTVCTSCKANSDFSIPNTHSPCECHSGYTMNENECVPTVDPSVLFVFDSEDTSFVANGFTMSFTNSPPYPVPTMGLYFAGGQFGELLPDTQPNTSTKSVEMWTRIDHEETGTIYTEQEVVDQVAMTKIDFRKDSDSSLALDLTFSNSEQSLTATGLKTRRWIKVGFSISATDEYSDVIIFINGLNSATTTYLDIYQPANTKYYIGGAPGVNGMNGFILSFSTSFGFIDTVLASVDDLCVSSLNCEITAGDCEFLQYTNTDGGCSSCDCGDSHSCARGEDCRLHIDKECKFYTNMYTCETCYEGANLEDGDCSCGVNEILNESTGACECIENYSVNDGVCSRCGNSFIPDEILAVMNEDYNQIIVDFAYEPEEKRTTCADLLKTHSFQHLGINPVCSWRTSKELQITIGLEFDVTMTQIEFEPEVFVKKYPKKCDNFITDLVIPIQHTAHTLTPTARLVAPDTFGIKCGAQLMLSAEQSLGLGGNLGEYIWSVVPEQSDLSEFLTSQVFSVVAIDPQLLIEQIYSFSLTVVNNHQQTSTVIHNINVFNDKTLSVVIDTGNSIDITASDTLLIRAKVEYNCDAEASTTYQWSALPGQSLDATAIIERTIDQPHLLQLEAGDFRPNESYQFLVEAKSGELTGSSEVTIHVKESSLVAKITNNSGTHSTAEDLTLDGSESYDPDSDITVLTYSWDCVEGNSECLDAEGNTLRIDSTKTVIVAKEKLREGAIYDIMLTVTNESRVSTDEVTITIVSDNSIVKEHAPFAVKPNIPFLLNEFLEGGLSSNITWTQVLGAPYRPSTSTEYPFIRFSGELLEPGNYYSWQIDYTDSSGNPVQSIYTWYTHTGADCFGELSAQNSEHEELFVMNNCLTKDGNAPIWYYFGIMLGDIELPLYGPTKSNYVYLRLPAGTYSVFGAVCDETLACTRKTYRNYAVTRSQEVPLESQEDFSSLFEFDTSDPEMTPATVFYIIREYEDLSDEVIEMLLDAMNNYMNSILEYNIVKVSTCIYVLTEFLQFQIRKAKHVIPVLDAIYVMLEKSGITMRSHDIDEIYDNLNQILPQFADDSEVMQATQRTIQKILVSYMETSPPFESPTIFSIGYMYSKKERSTALSFQDRTIEFFKNVIDLPSKLPFEDTDVIDVSVTVLEKNSTNVIELTFSKSGTYIDGVFTQEEEIILPLTNLDSPIRIEFPLRSKIENMECVYLKNDRWESSGCSIVDVLDNSCMVEVTHTSMFTLRESQSSTCNFYAVLLGSGLLLLMCIHVALAVVLKRKALQQPTKEFEMVAEKEQTEKKAAEEGTGENKLFEFAAEKKGEENPPPPPKKFTFKDMCRNHLLIGQIMPNFVPRDQRALLMYLGIFICFLCAGIVVTYENTIDDASAFIIFGFTIGLISVFITGVIEFILVCVENNIARNSIIGLALLAAFAGSVYIVTYTCSDSTTEWIIVFLIAVAADLFVYQTVLSAIKTLLYKTN